MPESNWYGIAMFLMGFMTCGFTAGALFLWIVRSQQQDK